MKIWIDDIRPAPDGYTHYFTTNSVIAEIRTGEKLGWTYELIDIDDDAGKYAKDGRDYINILKWLEKTGRNYPIRIHSMNPIGVENMRRIIQKNGWEEIF